MCPIRVSPEVPVYVSENEKDLGKGKSRQTPFEVRGEGYIRPAGKPAEYTVFVFGFPDSPGGMLTSERLTTGHSRDELTLTTPEDPDLSGELGVSEICVDGVIYEAVNPQK
jgi:hypothetical protein